ncbi:MAG: hypothetical protein ABJO02_16475 [Reichenbachiella sp.]|uniref:hypothetical protein n=1 Tax=Reichenbachiella sp. TaxID=2184521 RepID=UPI0032990A71
MKQYIATVALLAFTYCYAHSQNVGTIHPGNSFTNTSDQVLYYMPKHKVIEFLDLKTKSEFDSIRIEKYKQLTNDYQERIELSDSAAQIKNLEAEFWRQKLLSNDDELIAEKKTAIQLRADVESAKRSRFYFFIAGIVTTSVAVVALK